VIFHPPACEFCFCTHIIFSRKQIITKHSVPNRFCLCYSSFRVGPKKHLHVYYYIEEVTAEKVHPKASRPFTCPRSEVTVPLDLDLVEPIRATKGREQ
jgi:hypothetical protein